MWTTFLGWFGRNKLAALALAALSLSALANVCGGPPNLLAKKYLDLARGWYQVRQSEKAAWDARERDWTARATPAKGKLSAARKASPRPAPATATETAARFRELGYEGRVR